MHRQVIVECNSNKNQFVEQMIGEINNEVNAIIQELNLRIQDRRLPYISLTVSYNASFAQNDRMVIIERNTPKEFIDKASQSSNLIGKEISHMIHLLNADGFMDLCISTMGYDAQIVIPLYSMKCAIIDILLDIVVFNSYSFLVSKSMEEKHDFCYEKYEYYLEKNLPCFYNHKKVDKLYYSFAFAARQSESEFDCDYYIELWNSFIRDHHPQKIHIEPSLSKQLRDFKDSWSINNLVNQLKQKPAGAYLILRVNKKRTKQINEKIESLFGLKKRKNGKTHIIPLFDFKGKSDLCINLDVSVLKVVVADNSCNNF
jgi:hypothetical protein